MRNEFHDVYDQDIWPTQFTDMLSLFVIMSALFFMLLSMPSKSSGIPEAHRQSSSILDKRSSAPAPFAFQDLPLELAFEILAVAARSTHSTYRNLLLVSRRMQNLTHLACLPTIPILLKTAHHQISFHRFLLSHPETAPLVRHLWLVLEVSTQESQHYICAEIVDACTEITSLACDVPVVMASIAKSQKFNHTQCRSLTLATGDLPWENILNTPNGPKFLSQITHFRILDYCLPRFSPNSHFSNLTHLSLALRKSADSITATEIAGWAFRKADAHPALRRVVFTTQPDNWRGGPFNRYRSERLAKDTRMFILHCSEGWTDADAWEDSVRSGVSLWDRATLDVTQSIT